MPHVTLLVVDDDPALLRAFTRTFGKRYEILVAESGADALHALRTHPIDVAAELKAAQLVAAVLGKPWEAAEVDAAIARTFQLVTMRRAVRQMRSGLERVE